MIFSYNWLQSFFNKKLPAPEKLAEVLTKRSFEVREIKNIKIPSGDDVLLDIDILPDRTHDCFSHLGVAKEISALFNLPLKPFPEPKLKILKEKAEKYLKLKVLEPELCKRYMAAIMLNIKVGPSPLWLEKRLVAVGQKPINNIVDAANYVMFEMGQPLHAFDMNKISPAKIIVRRAKRGEKIITLDDKKFELDENILVIADNYEPLAIAGIKGGKKAEIDKKTKDIIIEAANFDFANVRSTSKKLGLVTGASVGFENGISPALAEKAMERMINLIYEVAGGELVAEKIDFYPAPVPAPKIILSQADVSKLLGVVIPEKDILSILNRLGFKIKKTKKELAVIGPIERLDIRGKEDIIEEIIRIYGYEKIPTKIPEGFLAPAARNDNFFYSNIIRDILVAAGFSEIYNYSFSPAGEVEIENPIAIDKKYLRANLLDGLKDNAERNLKYFDEIRIFETGKIFTRPLKGLVEEKNSLAGLISSKNQKTKMGEFLEIKGTLEMLFSKLGISDFWFDDLPENKNIRADRPLKLAEIKIGNDSIGFIDKNAFEIDLEKLVRLANEEIEYRPVSKYPAVIRDIAVLVSLKTRVMEVLDIIENTAGKLLIDTDLFDIYEGEELEGGRKNLAFHLIFQSPEKTLSDKEINSLMDKIIRALEENSSWRVRKN